MSLLTQPHVPDKLNCSVAIQIAVLASNFYFNTETQLYAHKQEQLSQNMDRKLLLTL